MPAAMRSPRSRRDPPGLRRHRTPTDAGGARRTPGRAEGGSAPPAKVANFHRRRVHHGFQIGFSGLII